MREDGRNGAVREKWSCEERGGAMREDGGDGAVGRERSCEKRMGQ